ncbi:MAG: phosphoribosylamine--glycine ligase [Carboxydocellales bacterium]
MKVLVVGGGGREHALVWKLKQSPRVQEIYCAPGNAGIAQMATCINIRAEDVNLLLAFAREKGIDLTVVGPEAPLLKGIREKFQQAGLKIFGPSQRAAEIEGSKAIAKELMEKYNIPTAGYAAFTDAAGAKAYIREHGAPCVVKADGLAAGKGVIVAMDEATAIEAIDTIMQERAFGDAGDMVIIEEYLEGEEVSILAFTDGETVIPMVSAQDHKRAYDGDEGPNTGGMGAYSPAPVYSPELAEQVLRDILIPTVQGLAQEGRTYSGVIYAGLMITKAGPKVLEYNARFGDPETQAVLVRLETDLVDIIEAILGGNLAQQEIHWKSEAAVCVVIAAGGYPGEYEKGKPISGLDSAGEQAVVFHAGTFQVDNRLVTNGGRVLGVTGIGNTIAEAIANTYEAVGEIVFANMHYRKDIGYRALKRF